MRSLAVALLALLVATVGSGCGGQGEEVARPSTTAAQPEPATVDSTREAAPPLAGVALDGDPVALADFRGRPVLINVWSSW